MAVRTVVPLVILVQALLGPGAGTPTEPPPSPSRPAADLGRADEEALRALAAKWREAAGTIDFRNGSQARLITISRGQIPEQGPLKGFLNLIGIIIRYDGGHFMPKQEVGMQTCTFRTLSTGLPSLQESLSGQTAFYDTADNAYVAMEHVSDYGNGLSSSSVRGADYFKWRTAQGATDSDINMEVSDMKKLGIGFVNSSRNFFKGWGQVVHIYDQKRFQVGALYVTKAGPNIAAIGDDLNVQTEAGLRRFRDIDADGSWKTIYPDDLRTSDSFRVYRGVVDGRIVKAGLRFNKDGELELFALP